MRVIVTLQLLSFLFLQACGRGGEENESPTHTMRTARSGLSVSAILLTITEADVAEAAMPISSIRTGVLLSAMNEVSPILPHEESFSSSSQKIVRPTDDTSALENLQNLYKTEIQVLLNTSPDRALALTTYIRSLEGALQDASMRHRALKDKREKLKDDERRLSRRVRELEKEIENSIKKRGVGSVSGLEREIIDTQRNLAELNLDLVITEQLLEGFDDILEPLTNRLHAIDLNREALLKGVRITETDGIDDLGIIKSENERERSRSRGRSLFGGDTF